MLRDILCSLMQLHTMLSVSMDRTSIIEEASGQTGLKGLIWKRLSSVIQISSEPVELWRVGEKRNRTWVGEKLHLICAKTWTSAAANVTSLYRLKRFELFSSRKEGKLHHQCTHVAQSRTHCFELLALTRIALDTFQFRHGVKHCRNDSKQIVSEACWIAFIISTGISYNSDIANRRLSDVGRRVVEFPINHARSRKLNSAMRDFFASLLIHHWP